MSRWVRSVWMCGLAVVFPTVLSAATFVVNDTGDTSDNNAGDGTCTDGSFCTLRAAIEEANALPGTDVIEFNIGGSTYVINVGSALPTITEAVTIDGFTEVGASANTQQVDGDAVVVDEVNGGGGTYDALHITSGGCTVKGLAFDNFDGDGIVIDTNGSNTIEGCFFGLDESGVAGTGMTGDGIVISGVSNNTIGGSTLAARCVIGVITGDGIKITGSGATGNTVKNCYVGVEEDGITGGGNTGNGIAIESGASSNTIGGTTATERNVITDNGGSGVLIDGSGTDNNVVQGNYSGIMADGSDVTGQGGPAVTIDNGASGNTIGGTVSGAGNVLSSSGDGVVIDNGSSSNTVAGNTIGLLPDGSTVAGSDGSGVRIAASSNSNTIGGTTSDARNVISGNGSEGVLIDGKGCWGTG